VPPHRRHPLTQDPRQRDPAASRLPRLPIRRPGPRNITGPCVQKGARLSRSLLCCPSRSGSALHAPGSPASSIPSACHSAELIRVRVASPGPPRLLAPIVPSGQIRLRSPSEFNDRRGRALREDVSLTSVWARSRRRQDGLAQVQSDEGVPQSEPRGGCAFSRIAHRGVLQNPRRFERGERIEPGVATRHDASPALRAPTRSLSGPGRESCLTPPVHHSLPLSPPSQSRLQCEGHPQWEALCPDLLTVERHNAQKPAIKLPLCVRRPRLD
jgi:hypothetical protein